MGRPRTVSKALPRYASAFADRHGKQRIRLRRQGWSTVYITAEPGSAEFTEVYHRWLKEGRIDIGVASIKPGSFDDLIARFYRSKDWASLKPTTRETYSGIYERFRAKYGDRQVSTMTARHVANLVSKMADTPAAANNLRKRLNQIFNFAILQGWRADNPAAAVRGIRQTGDGFATWQEAQIAQFEAHWPIGTMPRLAFDLALYTAQRRSDIRLMGPQHVEDGMIRVRQIKTGEPMRIPIDPRLAKSIAATKTGHLAFIIADSGRPFTEDGFGMWFMRRCREAGITGYSMHGLRKAAARRMAESGLSNQLIKSITGHRTDAEVSRYTREAEQTRMAKLAMAQMAKANLPNPDLANPNQHIENAG
ncbi:MAG: hypothetical protein EBR82_17130 [Caulobacteraceae bacterium]|nr:hypothetical protein [Caulobacteraceae bacterium]